MRVTRLCNFFLTLSVGALLAEPAYATLQHFMQIEQVIGGVNGDTTAQAIQLRMRTSAQNLVAVVRLRAWDAGGLNPVVVVDFTQNVPNGAAGAHILVASANFAGSTSPPASPDFVMTNLIPASYLAGGSLTFETDNGLLIYWRLSWGSYTGSNAGAITNDPDGNFGPPFPGPLPSSDLQALLFQGPAAAGSSNNAADYALTGGAAVFTNNAGASFTVTKPAPPGACCDKRGECTNDVTEAECSGPADTFFSGQSCVEVECPAGIPTVSQWGMIALGFLLLTAGTIVYKRRRSPSWGVV